MPNTYVALKTETVTVATGTVTFTDIPANYTDLVLVFNGSMVSSTRIDITVGNGTLDTGANYSNTALLGNGTVASSIRNSSTSSMQGMFDSLGTGTGQINSITSFQNYANTTTFKTVLSRSNSASNGVTAFVGLHRSTNAINIIRLTGLANFAVGSTFSLYGITANAFYTPSTIPATLNIGDQIYVAYTGSATTLSIPAGVNTMRLELVGASGGGDDVSFGGGGGYVAGNYSLGGSALTMTAFVGGFGLQRNDTNIAGGFNGGGSAPLSPSGNVGYCSGSGGGATDIRVGGTALGNRIFVAGGGGGGGGFVFQSGGFGGHPTGNPGSGETVPNNFSGARGQGGTQSAGGAGGLGATDGSPAGQAGSLGQGGNGAQGTYGVGGGGGGGYYGGGGGGGANNGGSAGGGGGSSFLGSLTNTTVINGLNAGHGYAILTKLT